MPRLVDKFQLVMTEEVGKSGDRLVKCCGQLNEMECGKRERVVELSWAGGVAEDEVVRLPHVFVTTHTLRVTVSVAGARSCPLRARRGGQWVPPTGRVSGDVFLTASVQEAGCRRADRCRGTAGSSLTPLQGGVQAGTGRAHGVRHRAHERITIRPVKRSWNIEDDRNSEETSGSEQLTHTKIAKSNTCDNHLSERHLYYDPYITWNMAGEQAEPGTTLQWKEHRWNGVARRNSVLLLCLGGQVRLSIVFSLGWVRYILCICYSCNYNEIIINRCR